MTSASRFLEINSDTQINGSLSVRDGINGALFEATPSAGTLAINSGDTTLTITNSATIDQDVSTTSTPTFNTLNLSATSNQLVFQSGGPASPSLGGPTGTLTWTPTAARIITLPDATTTLVGTDTTQTLTNKSMSGSSNTFTNIPNSALTNSSVTVTAGTNLEGGGTVALGGTITISAKSSPSFSGQVLIADGTAAAPGLAFTDDTNSGLYRIGTDNIALITGGTSTQGISIDSSGNVGIGTITPTTRLHVVGTATITGAATLSSSLDVSGNTGVGGSLTVTSAAILNSLQVTKSISGATLGISGNSNLSGNVGIGGSLTVASGTVLSSSLSVSGNTLLSTLNVSGTTNLNTAYVNSLGVGSLYNGITLPSNGLAVQGNVGIGTTSPSASLHVIGTTQTRGNILTDVNNTYDIGSAALTFKTIYANEINATNIVGTITTGSISADTLTINSDNLSADTEDANLRFHRGTGSPHALLTWDSTNDEFDLNSQLHITGTITSTNGIILDGFTTDITTGTNEHLSLMPNGTGNVGIGTTSPIAALHVVGQCVTGDTRLRRRKKKGKGSRGKGEDEWEKVRIDQIKPGDEILTLDEKSGEFIPSKVNALMDMGIQKTYLLITDTGKTIRTTANHPYFVKETKETTIIGGIFEVDQSPKLEQLSQDSFIALANKNSHFIIKISRKYKKLLYQRYQAKNKQQFFAPDIFARAINMLLSLDKIRPFELKIDNEYTGYETRIREIITRTNPNLLVSYRSLGHSALSYAHWAAYRAFKGEYAADLELSEEGKVAKEKDRGTQRVGLGIVAPIPLNRIRNARDLIKVDYHKLDDLSTHSINSHSSLSLRAHPSESKTGLILSLPNVSTAKWVKVYDIKPGMGIATVNGWEKIVAIKEFSREQVWDIEIANTHNFVGNDIVAHNTYISGNVGIGATTSSNKLDVWGNARITGTLSVDGALTTNGSITPSGQFLAIDGTALAPGYSFTNDTDTGIFRPFTNALGLSTGGTSRLTITADGNVGIGTTNPTAALDVRSAISIGANAASAGTLRLPNAGTITMRNLANSADVTLITGGQGTNPNCNDCTLFNNTTQFQNSVNFSGGSLLGFYDTAGTSHLTINAATTYAAIQSYNNQPLIINSLGNNVGIGLTTANSQLSISNNVHIGSLFQGISAPANGLFVDGNVGIGATTSSNKLDVWGNARITGTLTVDQGTTFGGNLTLAGSLLPSVDNAFDLGSNTARWRDLYLGPNTLHIGTSTSDEYTIAYDTTNNRLGFNVNGSGPAEVVIDSSGNVGIGTTNPLSKLTISRGNDNGSLFRIGNDDGTVYAYYDFVRSAATGALSIQGSQAGFTNIVLAPTSGNVGIANASPVQQFQVNSTTSSFVVTAGGNVGIGNTNPGANLAVTGNSVIGFGGAGGGIAGPSNGLAVSGNVGVGTTSPIQALHVVGQCVAKGTRIRRKRKGSRGKGEDEYEEVPVEDIKPDDEILSLNDKSGAWEWNKVEKTMDMGIQEVFRLETASGKWIETTANHPYLVKHQKTALTAALVNLTGMLNDWTDTLNSNITQGGGIVKSENYLSVDLPGIEPGRLGVSAQPSKPAKPTPISLSQITARWVKVSQLKTGMEIATADGWEKIVSITNAGRKQTYDLQIANTHNFVGNDIVAHNTYITGNVGIGATTSSNKLDVWGNARITGTLTVDQGTTFGGNLTLAGSLLPSVNDTYDLGSDSLRWRDLYLGPDTLHIGSSTSDEYAIAYDTTNNRLGFNVNGSGPAEFVMDSNGNLGIGTTNPGAKLIVTGGNVGLGINSAGDTLDVVGGTNVFDSGIIVRPNNQSQTLKIGYGGINASYSMILRAGGDGVLTHDFQNGAGLQRMVINTSGNVGIGTASPIAKLNLFGTGSSTGVNLLTQSSAGTFGLAVLDNGNVGIGTTGPATKFHLSGTTDASSRLTIQSTNGDSNAGLLLQNDVRQWLFQVQGSDADKLYIHDSTAGLTRMVIDSSGNVGIGTASPNTKLDVIGNGTYAASFMSGNVGIGTSSPTSALVVGSASEFSVSSGGLLTISEGTSGSQISLSKTVGLGYFLSLNQQGTDRLTYSVGGNLVNTGGSNNFWDLNFVSTSSTSIDIDIGTPEGVSGTGIDLTIDGLTSGKALVLNSAATAFTGSMQQINLTGSNAANTGSLLELANSGTANANTSLYIKHYATGANNLAFRVDDVSGDTSPFVIDGTGNVGIGTTGPGAALEIAGNLLFSKETARTISVTDSTTSNAAGAALSITSAAATSGGTGSGGALNLSAGAAGGVISGSAGNGGAVNITAGAVPASSNGNGGAVVIAGGAIGSGSNGDGGAISLTGGAANTGLGNGGAVSIIGGISGNSGGGGNGGAISIVSGAGISNGGLSGTVTIASGTTGTSGTVQATGAVTIQSGVGTTSTADTTAGSASGAVIVRSQGGGNGSSGGAGGNGGAAGSLTLSTGAGGAATGANTGGAGGAINITAGNGGNGTTSGAAGALTLTSGSAGSGGNLNGGNILLTTGAGTGTGVYGNIILAQNGGNVGIGFTSPGTKLDVFDTTSSSNVDIFRVLSAVGGAGSVKFRVDSDGDVFSDGGTAMGTPADVAENYPVLDEEIEAGDLVTTSDIISEIKNKYGEIQPYIEKSNSSYQNNLIGIISTKPGVLLSANTVGRAVALAGRVPVKVSTENGPIAIGDYLTSSSIPGVAMKATKPGQVVGKALEAFDGTTIDGRQVEDRILKIENGGLNEASPSSTFDSQNSTLNPLSSTVKITKILTFVNVSYADPGNFLASLSLDDDGNLIAPKIKTEKLLLSAGINLEIDDQTILAYDTSNLANGDTEYVVDVYQSLKNLENAVLEIGNRQQALGDSIATQSAELAAKVATSSASSDCTLSPDACSLSLTPPDILYATGSADLASTAYSLQPTAYSDATVSGMLTAYQAEISDHFKVYGQTTLSKTAINGDLFVDGTLSIENGSEINVMGTLFLQKGLLAENVNIFDGKVVIDNEGNIKTSGYIHAQALNVAGEIAGASIITNKLTISNTSIATPSATMAPTIGTGEIPAGQLNVTINTTQVSLTSKIFVTPRGRIGNQALVVESVIEGENFIVSLDHSLADDLEFDWWIVDTK